MNERENEWEKSAEETSIVLFLFYLASRDGRAIIIIDYHVVNNDGLFGKFGDR